MVTAGIKKNEQPSTGMAEIHQVIIGLIEGRKWSITKGHKQEAGLLNQLFTQADKGVASDNLDFKASDEKDYDDNSFQQHSNPTSPGGQSRDAHGISKKVIQEKFFKFKELIENENKEEAKLLLKDIIILLNTDTGGQTEFLEMLAPLILGPSLYLLYHRLTDKLDKKYPMWATNSKGMDTEKEDSTITLEDFLFQALASIACFRNPDTEDEAGSKPVGEDNLKKYAKVSKRSKVMIVGTHRDEVSDEEFVKHDELLQGKITNTDYEDIVEFASEDHLILDINNFNGGEKDRKHFHDALLRVIYGSFAEVEIPAAWLMLSLYIRIMERRIMTLKELEALAGEIQISPEELQVALWFFHRIMGLFLYYPELEELKDVVICDVRVVFDSITELIKNTFVFDKVGKPAAEKFKATAQFTTKDLETAIDKNQRTSSTEDNSLIPLPKLVKLLEYLNIMTTLSPSSGRENMTYFMLCVLRSSLAKELTVLGQAFSDPASLMIRYECGYVPLGVFIGMITNLVSQTQKELRYWKLIEEGMMRNRVEFRVCKGADLVTLISRPRCIEIVVTKKSQTSTESLCTRVRSVMESTLSEVTSSMNYDFNMAYNFAFECPVHGGRDHLAILSSETDSYMTCSQDRKQESPLPLKWQHRVWFNCKSILHIIMVFQFIHFLFFSDTRQCGNISYR